MVFTSAHAFFIKSITDFLFLAGTTQVPENLNCNALFSIEIFILYCFITIIFVGHYTFSKAGHDYMGSYYVGDTGNNLPFLLCVSLTTIRIY